MYIYMYIRTMCVPAQGIVQCIYMHIAGVEVLHVCVYTYMYSACIMVHVLCMCGGKGLSAHSKPFPTASLLEV